MADKKKRMQLVSVKNISNEGKDDQAYWTSIGTAFENNDGSFNLVFDYFPVVSDRENVRFTIQMRDYKEKE